MDLSGRNVLIAGGAGLIGTAVTLELLAKGAKVIVTTRSMERFDTMKKKLPADKLSNVSAIQADVTSEEGVAAIFAESTKQPGGVQHVIASIGSWWQGGKLAEQPLQEFNTCIKDRVTGHFLLFKAFADYLEKQQGGTYTMLTGGAGDYYMAPGISLLCITSGALHGFSTAARAELKDNALRFCDFRIHLMVLDKRDEDLPQVDDHQLGSDLVAKAIVHSLTNRTHDRKDVYCRQDAKKLASA